MVKLESVFFNGFGSYFGDNDIERLIKEKNIRSIGELLELKEKYPQLNWERYDAYIKDAEKYVNRANANGKDSEIIVPKAYSDKRLNDVDKEICASELIVQNPTNETPSTYFALRYMNISNLKRDIQLTNERGINFLRSYYRNIGTESLKRIASGLEFYTEQVERQAKLYDDWSFNLFYKDYLPKEEIVTDLYSKIVLFLAYNDNVRTVWGNLSDEQRKKIVSSALGDTKLDKIIRKRLINNFALYTTLPELEDLSSGKIKVLNRFLIK